MRLNTKRDIATTIASETDHGLLVLDGLDEALIGIASIPGQEPRLAYDVGTIICILMMQGMSKEDANEHFEFNIASLYGGPGTPVMVDGRAFTIPEQP